VQFNLGIQAKSGALAPEEQGQPASPFVKWDAFDLQNRAESQISTRTPFQNAMRSLISAAAGFGSG
jgi:hypothetical protein